jgi:hypothetical protein
MCGTDTGLHCCSYNRSGTCPPLVPLVSKAPRCPPPQRGILLSGSFRTMSQSGACIRSDGLGISKPVAKTVSTEPFSYVTG